MLLVTEDSALPSRFCPCLYYNAVFEHVKEDWKIPPSLTGFLLITLTTVLQKKSLTANGSGPSPADDRSISS